MKRDLVERLTTWNATGWRWLARWCPGLVPGCAVAMLQAAEVTLAWDPSPSPEVVGYVLYHGTSSGLYSHRNDVGGATTHKLVGLEADTLYFFAATSYTADGLESDYSNEVSYKTPADVPLPPTAVHLAGFEAVMGEDGRVEVIWRTLAEWDSLGFYVERAGADGEWRRISPMIGATGGYQPQSYGFTDSTVPAGSTVRYRLIEVDLQGRLAVQAEGRPVKQPRIRINRGADRVTLQVEGQPGDAVRIETSDGTPGWVPVGELDLGPDGVGRWILPWRGEETLRLYRARRR